VEYQDLPCTAEPPAAWVREAVELHAQTGQLDSPANNLRRRAARREPRALQIGRPDGPERSLPEANTG
jgi:hypothetical protein